MDTSPAHDEETATRIRVSEALHTGPLAPVSRAGEGLEIAFYPERIARPPAPQELTPSQALRFADDPGRAAAAAETAGSRTTMAPTGPIHHPQQGDPERSATPPAHEPERPRSGVRDEAAPAPDTERNELPVSPSDAARPPQALRTDDAAPPAAEHPDDGIPAGPRTWSTSLGAFPPVQRPSWWRRLLRLGG